MVSGSAKGPERFQSILRRPTTTSASAGSRGSSASIWPMILGSAGRKKPLPASSAVAAASSFSSALLRIVEKLSSGSTLKLALPSDACTPDPDFIAASAANSSATAAITPSATLVQSKPGPLDPPDAASLIAPLPHPVRSRR